jgi:pilus assembly protein Flp/PilA
MERFIEFIKRYDLREEGQDLVEYAMLVALIALVAAAGVGFFGTQINAWFSGLAGSIPLT